MMWTIPAKTFLLGEYAVIFDAPGIVLTTTPCFRVSLSSNSGLEGIHPESPAGRYWSKEGVPEYGLRWEDPYHNAGGMGASSAQFIGAYLAIHYLNNTASSRKALLEKYWQYAWNNQGIRPSGYDIVAQTYHDCVHIQQKNHECELYAWPFQDIDFLLIHTQNKLATHDHLRSVSLTKNAIQPLLPLIGNAQRAFKESDSNLLIEAIQHYHQHLLYLELVAPETIKMINTLRSHCLAIKGCGAMGADILLLIVKSEGIQEQQEALEKAGYYVIANTTQIFKKNPLLFE